MKKLLDKRNSKPGQNNSQAQAQRPDKKKSQSAKKRKSVGQSQQQGESEPSVTLFGQNDQAFTVTVKKLEGFCSTFNKTKAEVQEVLVKCNGDEMQAA